MDNVLPVDVANLLKAIRFALVQLENGINAADHELLWSLFTVSSVVITPTAKVVAFPSSCLPLPRLLSGENDLQVGCTLTVHDVLLLTPSIACADIRLHLRLVHNMKVVEISNKYTAVLEQHALTAEWLFILLQHVKSG